VGQTVPLDLAAYALAHPGGTPETNHAHAIQTEVFGFASEDLLRDPGICRWLGERVLAPVLDAGVPIRLAHVAPSDGSDAYGLDGSVRLSWAWWAGFDGQCGHQNVPGNSHWDAGRADYLAIAKAARPTPVSDSMEDDSMTIIRNGGRAWFLHAGKMVVCTGHSHIEGAIDDPAIGVLSVEDDDLERLMRAYPVSG
jgi:hypothetical protein